MADQSQVHPNFFIIGAPKSGTTALSEYLRQHPSVLFSHPKEPHFFNDDFSHRHIESEEKYLECFSHGRGIEEAIGEGSVFYLYSNNAVENIVKKYPRARFIVMLRNPVEAAYSWHWQSVFSFGEDVEDFEAAWRLQGKRAKRIDLPKYNWVREALQYGPLFSYASQLKRLFDHVPKKRVQIILYDDFEKNPYQVYQNTLKFLSLEPFYLEQCDRINPSKRFRWPWVEQFVRLGGSAKRILGINCGLGVLTSLQRMNTRNESRPALRPEFRAELVNYYREDVLHTAKLIDCDLSEWLND